MKKILKKIILRILRSINYRLGLDLISQVNDFEKNNLLNNLISILIENKFKPQLIIDVGANHGTWVRLWKDAFPQSNFILVEPQSWLESSFIDLLDSKTRYLPVGAGKENGTFLFTINSDRDDSSTFALSSEEAHSRGYRQIEIPIHTLNTIVEQNGNIMPDIVKIDAEGLDIEVLEGASNLLGKTEIFLVEASINSTFEATDIAKVIAYMDSKGYRTFDITDINRPFKNKVLWLVEIAFVRKGGVLDSINWL
jgi:FkbM family methyltransferase